MDEIRSNIPDNCNRRVNIGIAFALSAVLSGTLTTVTVAEPLTGTPGPDILAGRAGPSLIRALDGNDTVYGDPISGDESDPGARLASVTKSGKQGRGDASGPVMSPDGRLVAFTSAADNLVIDDDNRDDDVFLKDMVSGELTRASAPTSGLDWGGSGEPDFSPTGRTLAFASGRPDYVIGDENGVGDIFLKDLSTGAIRRVSTRADGGEANGGSGGTTFSPDGHRIAFHSYATNLVDGDTNGVYDVFLKNLDTGDVERISVTMHGGQANANCLDPVFSPDGSSVLFHSDASNLVTGDTNKTGDIFIKDLVSGELTRLSVSSAGFQANGPSGYGLQPFSPDGLKVVFSSSANNLAPDDTNHWPDVYVRTLATGATELISRPASPADGPGGGAEGSFSPDGTKIAFSGWPSRYFPKIGSDTPVVLIKDLQTGAVGIASKSREGGIPNGPSNTAAFSVDGRTLLFLSHASNIASDKHQNYYFMDVFLSSLVPGPSGADVIDGGSGDDTLNGLAGADRMDGGPGDDQLDGGSGIDVADYGACAQPVTARLVRSGKGKAESEDCGSDSLLRMESLRGGIAGDRLEVGVPGGTLEGGGGDDTLVGGKGRQTVSYQTATAPIRVDLGTGKAIGPSEGADGLAGIEDVVGTNLPAGDRLTGNASANRLEGLAGPDVMDGRPGNDEIVGGPGRDRMSGGAGADRFRWDASKDSPANDPDAVLDFQRSDHDRVDMTPLGALTYIGSSPFSAAGQLRAVRVKGGLRLEVNLRGKTSAEMAIWLKGVNAFDPLIDMVHR